MYQDILNLNATTKSILKNPNNQSSLAYTNSILRKDPSKVNVEGIGLNPNVPLEDEYISNLQKQIHFMDLEIKLMKEKSAQEEALGGNYQFSKIGLADGKPPMDHILTTTTKLKQMKLDLTKQINLLENELMKNKEENTVSGAKLANLARHITDYDEKLTAVLKANSESLNAIKTKFLNEKRQKEEFAADIHKAKTQLEKLQEENAKLRKETQMREIDATQLQKRFDEDEHFDHEAIAAKVKFIDALQKEQMQFKLVLEKNPRLISLRKENEELQEQVKKAETELDDINYKVLESETLQALSVKKKDEDQENRKKLQAELEKWRDQLEETIKSNDLKVERKLREAESAKIKELHAELLKERHELNELTTKFEAMCTREKEYIREQSDRVRHRDDLIKKKDLGLKTNKTLTDEVQLLDPQVVELQNKVEALRLKTSDVREEREKLQNRLTQVEEENISLLSKLNFMQHNIKLEDDMRKFNMEGLRNVVQTNQNVNDTIKEFMKKWDTLKKFTKQP